MNFICSSFIWLYLTKYYWLLFKYSRNLDCVVVNEIIGCPDIHLLGNCPFASQLSTNWWQWLGFIIIYCSHPVLFGQFTNLYIFIIQDQTTIGRMLQIATDRRDIFLFRFNFLCIIYAVLQSVTIDSGCSNVICFWILVWIAQQQFY